MTVKRIIKLREKTVTARKAIKKRIKKTPVVFELAKKTSRETSGIYPIDSYNKEIEIPVKIIKMIKIKYIEAVPNELKLSVLSNIAFISMAQDLVYKSRNEWLEDQKKIFFGKITMLVSLVLIFGLTIGQTFSVLGSEARVIDVTAKICRSSDCSSAPLYVSNPASISVTNSASECVLNIAKEVDKTEALIGDTLTYTLNFSNIGMADCTDVKVKDIVDTNLIFIAKTHSESVSLGYDSNPFYDISQGVLLWNVGELSPQESGTIDWKGKINIENDKSCLENIANATDVSEEIRSVVDIYNINESAQGNKIEDNKEEDVKDQNIDNRNENKCRGDDILGFGSIASSKVSGAEIWVNSNQVLTKVVKSLSIVADKEDLSGVTGMDKDKISDQGLDLNSRADVSITNSGSSGQNIDMTSDAVIGNETEEDISTSNIENIDKSQIAGSLPVSELLPLPSPLTDFSADLSQLSGSTDEELLLLPELTPTPTPMPVMPLVLESTQLSESTQDKIIETSNKSIKD